MIALETRDIGGGIVRRLFTAGTRTYRAGERLSAEEISSWPIANRRALVANRFLEVYPATPEPSVTPSIERRKRA